MNRRCRVVVPLVAAAGGEPDADDDLPVNAVDSLLPLQQQQQIFNCKNIQIIRPLSSRTTTRQRK